MRCSGIVIVHMSALEVNRVPLGESGIEVSRVGFGTYHLAQKIDEFAALEAFADAYESGVNLFDTSDNYGTEAIIGTAIRANVLPRHDVVIATKTGLGTSYAHQMELNKAGRKGDTSPERIREQVDRSLTVLGPDIGAIDLYQLHVHDPTVDPREHAAVMDELIDDEKMKAWGVSNYSYEALYDLLSACDAMGLERPSTSQPFLNMASGVEEVVHLAQQTGLTVLGHSPLLKGMLTDKTVVEWLAQAQEALVRLEGADLSDDFKVIKEGLDRCNDLRVYAADHSLTLAQLAISWVTSQPNTVALTACTTEDYLNDAMLGANHKTDVADPELNDIIDALSAIPFGGWALKLMRESKYYYH